jgi:hypothetical protein
MPLFHLTERAKTDLRSIGRYTQATWGREQRNSFLPGWMPVFICWRTSRTGDAPVTIFVQGIASIM